MAFQQVTLEPFQLDLLGLALWEMVYSKGWLRRTTSRVARGLATSRLHNCSPIAVCR